MARTYKFIESDVPGSWDVFHAATMIRVPGFVVRDSEGFVFERHLRGAKADFRIEAKTVAELDAKVTEHFEREAGRWACRTTG